MDQLSCILLHMDFMNAYLLLPCCRFDFHAAVPADWKIQLGNLIVLRIIRVKIILSVKFAVPGNRAVHGKPYCHRIFQHFLIQHGQ